MRFDSCFKTNVFGGATRVGKVTQSGRHRKVSHFRPDSAVWPHPIPYLTLPVYLTYLQTFQCMELVLAYLGRRMYLRSAGIINLSETGTTYET